MGSSADDGGWRGFAAAKVNLFLHVGPRAADGYHPISSWMVFADVGDALRFDPGAPAGLRIEGEFAADISAGADNLVLRARDALASAAGIGAPAGRLTLMKRLPLAAGLGGGSADAAATLRLLNTALRLGVAEERLAALADGLGSDVAACLAGRPVIAEGRGGTLSSAPAAPPLDAVLVNPGVPSSTAAVYRAYDDAGAPGGADRPVMPGGFADASAVARFLASCRNDLEAPAVAAAPAIGEALQRLATLPQTLLARMSGSGATVFALTRNARDAEALAGDLRSERPTWWVRACRLGDAPQ